MCCINILINVRKRAELWTTDPVTKIIESCVVQHWYFEAFPRPLNMLSSLDTAMNAINLADLQM